MNFNPSKFLLKDLTTLFKIPSAHCKPQSTYSRVRNKHAGTFINFQHQALFQQTWNLFRTADIKIFQKLYFWVVKSIIGHKKMHFSSIKSQFSNRHVY